MYVATIIEKKKNNNMRNLRGKKRKSSFLIFELIFHLTNILAQLYINMMYYLIFGVSPYSLVGMKKLFY